MPEEADESGAASYTGAMRTPIAALTMLLLSSAANAQQWDVFDACATNQDPAARLACFDQAVAARRATRAAPAAMPGSVSAPSAGVAPSAPVAPITAAPAARPAPAPAADSDVGLSAQQVRKQRAERGEAVAAPPAATVFTATLIRVIPRTPLISAFELSNGQIWEQTEAMKFEAEPQQTVTVRHGALGSFFLKNAAGTSVRVHRLK